MSHVARRRPAWRPTTRNIPSFGSTLAWTFVCVRGACACVGARSDGGAGPLCARLCVCEPVFRVAGGFQHMCAAAPREILREREIAGKNCRAGENRPRLPQSAPQILAEYSQSSPMSAHCPARVLPAMLPWRGWGAMRAESSRQRACTVAGGVSGVSDNYVHGLHSLP